MLAEITHEEAVEKGKLDLRTLPRAVCVRFNPVSRLVEIELNTGYSIHFSGERVQDLRRATDQQLSEVEIAGVGFGIYFPQIDVDLWVPSLAKGRFGDDRWEAEWIATHPLEGNPPVFEHQDADETVAA